MPLLCFYFILILWSKEVTPLSVGAKRGDNEWELENGGVNGDPLLKPHGHDNQGRFHMSVGKDTK